MLSLPLRECGLKSMLSNAVVFLDESLPLRECGLKSVDSGLTGNQVRVTPLAGVWIEIKNVDFCTAVQKSHSPCGSVD